jgi:hypothetical protein
MKRPRTLLVAAAFAGLVGVVGVWNAAAQPHGRAGTPTVKAEPYLVVQTGDDLQVMTRSEFLALKKSAKEKYKQELTQYNQDKKDAAKKKEKFDGPKPLKVEPKQIGATFKTKDEADAFCEKRKREREEGKSEKKAAHS